MAHSKRNTTRAFFTAHERAELKGIWGSNSTRLTRESFLPFGSCNLCLLQARDPVSCSTEGHLFCRECALSNLLAQSKEIKRSKKEARRRDAEEVDEKQLADADAHAKDLESFERLQAGVDSRDIAGQKRKRLDNTDDGVRDPKRREPGQDKGDSSFWVPSQTHTAKSDHARTFKQNPICPISTKAHEFSLKSFITVKFTEQQSTDGLTTSQSCPSCNKTLSNTTKAMLAKQCGHVLCKSCSDQFQKPPEKSAHDQADTDNAVRCYVCQEDITTAVAQDKLDKRIKPSCGLVELKSDGTGFAGGGENMVKKEGLAFQFG